jgi:hypothetical protein
MKTNESAAVCRQPMQVMVVLITASTDPTPTSSKAMAMRRRHTLASVLRQGERGSFGQINVAAPDRLLKQRRRDPRSIRKINHPRKFMQV